MSSAERKQDTWFATVTFRDALGKDLGGQRGIIDLPCPMVALDAADYVTRYMVRQVTREFTGEAPYEIHSVVWGKREPNLYFTSIVDPGRYQKAGFLAQYDKELDAYMRPEIRGVQGRREIKAHEGAKFIECDWQ